MSLTRLSRPGRDWYLTSRMGTEKWQNFLQCILARTKRLLKPKKGQNTRETSLKKPKLLLFFYCNAPIVCPIHSHFQVMKNDQTADSTAYRGRHLSILSTLSNRGRDLSSLSTVSTYHLSLFSVYFHIFSHIEVVTSLAFLNTVSSLHFSLLFSVLYIFCHIEVVTALAFLQ
jgi:hypothetical protein